MHSFLAVWCAFICFATTIAYPKNDTKLWSHTFKVGEKSFFIDIEKVNFDDAMKFCNSQDMQLATLKTSSENANLLAQLRGIGGYVSTSSFWTSGTKLAKSNDWIWLTNNLEIITFFDWGTGEPSNNDGNENCLVVAPSFYSSGHWNDAPCTSLLYPICESKLNPKNIINVPIRID
ncbi:unnamed protein product [Psylliodes chrysocephalus]|uniref:C-type lectin domain-containing protein n=1 Tax=Psylliodes chrysocephalus TaxID=3402493 RepID=A0A9P0CPE6_9CUCU|nr:unnamed protein product [Psylliodes chrysocephala]